MAHKITRFALTELYNKPHLITETALLPILDYVDMRNLQDFKFEEGEYEEDSERSELIDGVGIIKIHGSLSYRPLMTMCGAVGTSYQGLIPEVDYLISKGATTLLFDVNSGGGEAYSCFTTATEIRQMCDANDVKLIAYVDGMAASAAYALACVADEVVAHSNASVGSIGCLIALYNDTEALKKEGYERKFISFPKDKVPFDDEGKFTDKFISRLNKSVTELGMEFFEHVSAYTGLSIEQITALDAQVFSAKEAKEHGLINKIMSQKEFSDYVGNEYMKPKQNRSFI